MRVKFSKYAVFELHDAIEFYNQEYPGLGNRFKQEIKEAAERIRDYPTAWSN